MLSPFCIYRFDTLNGRTYGLAHQLIFGWSAVRAHPATELQQSRHGNCEQQVSRSSPSVIVMMRLGNNELGTNIFGRNGQSFWNFHRPRHTQHGRSRRLPPCPAPSPHKYTSGQIHCGSAEHKRTNASHGDHEYSGVALANARRAVARGFRLKASCMLGISQGSDQPSRTSHPDR